MSENQATLPLTVRSRTHSPGRTQGSLLRTWWNRGQFGAVDEYDRRGAVQLQLDLVPSAGRWQFALSDRGLQRTMKTVASSDAHLLGIDSHHISWSGFRLDASHERPLHFRSRSESRLNQRDEAESTQRNSLAHSSGRVNGKEIAP